MAARRAKALAALFTLATLTALLLTVEVLMLGVL